MSGNEYKKGKGGGAPKGNRNAAKDRYFRKALTEQLRTYKAEGIEEGQALNVIARKCVEDALSTDPDVRITARKEIADRLDGKPTEHIEADFTSRLAEELSDEELLSIARGGSDGAAEETGSAKDDSSVH